MMVASILFMLQMALASGAPVDVLGKSDKAVGKYDLPIISVPADTDSLIIEFDRTGLDVATTAFSITVLYSDDGITFQFLCGGGRRAGSAAAGRIFLSCQLPNKSSVARKISGTLEVLGGTFNTGAVVTVK